MSQILHVCNNCLEPEDLERAVYYNQTLTAPNFLNCKAKVVISFQLISKPKQGQYIYRDLKLQYCYYHFPMYA